MAPETRLGTDKSGTFLTLVKSVEFRDFINSIVSDKCNKFEELITDLKNEVLILKETNIQLINLLTANNTDARCLHNSSLPGNNVDPRHSNNTPLERKSNNIPYALIAARNTANNTSKNKKKQVTSPSVQKIDLTEETKSESLSNKNRAELKNWTAVTKKSNRKSTIICGSNNTETVIKGVVKYAHLHVFRLAPTVTEDNLKDYLTSKGIDKLKCEKLISKHPDDYSSFKVSVPMDMLERVKQPTMWPENVCVNRFFHHLTRNPTKT